MKATAEKTDKNSVKLTIEIDAEEFDKSMQKAYLKNRKHINIPGFRKGKAPRKIIEQFYGEAIFYEDAANDVIISTYSDAVKETGIEPVSQPEFDIIQIGNGQNFIYSADVVVKPEVELGEYKGIEIEKVEYNVTDEDVENEISKIREENARLINIEDRPVQEGDQVILDYKGMIDGEEFEGGSAENAVLEVGSNMFIPGFEEQLIGMNIGEEKEIKVTFPEDYHVEEIKGKEA
ncbi:MAG TPA: trigger factor, partial [Clostridiales bacterium]|nr:trigger factor [Clostridiales bacterium]